MTSRPAGSPPERPPTRPGPRPGAPLAARALPWAFAAAVLLVGQLVGHRFPVSSLSTFAGQGDSTGVARLVVAQLPDGRLLAPTDVPELACGQGFDVAETIRSRFGPPFTHGARDAALDAHVGRDAPASSGAMVPLLLRVYERATEPTRFRPSHFPGRVTDRIVGGLRVSQGVLVDCAAP